MKRIITAALAIGLLFAGCRPKEEHKAPPKKFYSKIFDWRITIPKNFELVPGEDWQRMRGRGQAALEKTVGTKLDLNVKVLFSFRSDKVHYLQANYEPFDTLTDGSFQESLVYVKGLVYQTFIEQMPDVAIDTASSKESISGVEFDHFQVKMTMPDKKGVIHLETYNRLFGDKELNITISYTDQAKGEEMLNAFRSSTFGNKPADK